MSNLMVFILAIVLGFIVNGLISTCEKPLQPSSYTTTTQAIIKPAPLASPPIEAAPFAADTDTYAEFESDRDEYDIRYESSRWQWYKNNVLIQPQPETYIQSQWDDDGTEILRFTAIVDHAPMRMWVKVQRGQP